MSTADEIARQQIEAHEKVCVERYGNIWEKLGSIEKSLSEANTQHHARFNTISNRMWTAAVGLIVMALAAAGSLVIIVFTMLQHLAAPRP